MFLSPPHPSQKALRVQTVSMVVGGGVDKGEHPFLPWGPRLQIPLSPANSTCRDMQFWLLHCSACSWEWQGGPRFRGETNWLRSASLSFPFRVCSERA